MSLDRRLREEIDRITSELRPDVERHLDQAIRHGRRRIALRRAGAIFAVAGAIAGAVVIGPHALHDLRNLTRHPTGPANPTITIGTPAIAGTYSRIVSAKDPAIQSSHLAGRWTIELRPDGTMAVTAPPSFAGVLSGVQFRARGGTFRTNIFVQDVCSGSTPPTYEWARVGGYLTFNPIADECAARVAWLSSGPWVSDG